MKRRYLLLFCLISFINYCYCQERPFKPIIISGGTQGTYYRITYYAVDSVVGKSDVETFLENFITVHMTKPPARFAATGIPAYRRSPWSPRSIQTIALWMDAWRRSEQGERFGRRTARVYGAYPQLFLWTRVRRIKAARKRLTHSYWNEKMSLSLTK